MITRREIDKQLCFVIMPFASPFTEYYERIIKPVVVEIGLKTLRSDEIYGTHTIIHDIWKSICKARLVIADVSTKNPNVNYELGLCHAIGVTTILIAGRIQDVPFDYRHRRCIIYNTAEADWERELAAKLKRTLEVAISEKDPTPILPWPYEHTRAGFPRFLGKPIVAMFSALWLNVLILFLANAISVEVAAINFALMAVALTVVVLRQLGDT
jgi:hypothetical protein